MGELGRIVKHKQPTSVKHRIKVLQYYLNCITDAFDSVLF